MTEPSKQLAAADFERLAARQVRCINLRIAAEARPGQDERLSADSRIASLEEADRTRIEEYLSEQEVPLSS